MDVGVQRSSKVSEYTSTEKQTLIAKETRRGKGNVVICSSDVATALAAAGTLDYSPAITSNLQVDDTGNTFAGLLNGRIKVYIDPYASTDYITVGYKGSNPYDSGVFYCPYVPLQMVKAVSENSLLRKSVSKLVTVWRLTHS